MIAAVDWQLTGSDTSAPLGPSDVWPDKAKERPLLWNTKLKGKEED
jgi:hypothetical protein